jgi:DNA recombination-dependent growth factor C
LSVKGESEYEEAEKQSADDEFDADLTLMSDDLAQMLADLALSLEVTDESASAAKA